MSDPWWRRRKKKSPWFSDIYEELERLSNMIEETMHKAFENSPENSSFRRNRIQGFSLKIGPDGKPKIREIDDNNEQDETEYCDDFEPLVDIIEDETILLILVALPGVKKDDIDLRITENCLSVAVDTEDFEWYDELNLPAKVSTKSARALYKNGVLEVRLEKVEKTIKEGKLSVKK
jgi:HSP20 family protein